MKTLQRITAVVIANLIFAIWPIATPAMKMWAIFNIQRID